jgi:catechol 2,3-dioxygenase-like lactoylglutathione lyase family enzyme
MAIIGTHMLFYTPEAEALRAMLRRVFGFKSVDAGGGWLIFALPPAELGVHPVEVSAHESIARHQVAFMCDDMGKTVGQLRAKGVQFEGEPQQQSWGSVAMMILPGDLKVMLYQPRHKLAITAAKAKASK